MFAVRGAPLLLVLLAVSTLASSAWRINREDLERAFTSHSDGYEGGGGSDRYAVHQEKTGDRVDEGYKGQLVLKEATTGQHGMGEIDGHHGEQGGVAEHRHRDDGYHDEHHEGEDGERGEKFHDKGRYGKGHSTHGHHEVKTLDEYKTHKEFHDGDHDSDFDEHDGGHYDDHWQQEGGYYEGGAGDYSEHGADHGKKDHHEKGHRYRDHEGHDSDGGLEDYYRENYRDGKKDSRDDGKKWDYEKGH